MKEAILKKIEYPSEKYIKTVFLIGFKNNIRHVAAVVGYTLLKTFPGSSSSLSGLAQAEWRRFPVGSFPSNTQEIKDDV